MKINNRLLDSLAMRPKAKPVFESEPVNLPPPPPPRNWFTLQAPPMDVVDSYHAANVSEVSKVGRKRIVNRAWARRKSSGVHVAGKERRTS